MSSAALVVAPALVANVRSPSFPPKLNKSSPPVSASDLLFPSTPIAQVLPFWDSNAREKLRKPHFTKRKIDARRAEVRAGGGWTCFHRHLRLPPPLPRTQFLIPGTPLSAIEQDDRIPLLLTQRTLTPSSPLATSPDAASMSGWTLTIPSGWGMAFWPSLVFSETRIGGLRERSPQFFEGGAPRFSEDYRGTVAFGEYELRREFEDKGYFDRRPPAKRPSYAKLGTEWLWRAEMGEVVRLRWEEREGEAEGKRGKDVWAVPVKVAKRVVEVSGGAKAVEHDTREIAGRLATEWEAQLAAQEDGKRWSLQRKDGVLREAVVRVKMTPCGRGAPEDLGMVYWMDEERRATVS